MWLCRKEQPGPQSELGSLITLARPPEEPNWLRRLVLVWLRSVTTIKGWFCSTSIAGKKKKEEKKEENQTCRGLNLSSALTQRVDEAPLWIFGGFNWWLFPELSSFHHSAFELFCRILLLRRKRCFDCTCVYINTLNWCVCTCVDIFSVHTCHLIYCPLIICAIFPAHSSPIAPSLYNNLATGTLTHIDTFLIN